MTSSLSLEQKIGQLIITGLPETDPQPNSPWLELVNKSLVGGILLYDRNISNPEQLKTLTGRFSAVAPEEAPLLISIDQEGGNVARLNSRNGFPESPTAEQIGSMHATEIPGSLNKIAKLLSEYGVNYNLAPCVDLGLEPKNFIKQKGRCFGEKTDVVSELAQSFVAAHRYNGVLTSVKHFPGHGSSLGDSHEGFTDVTHTWNETELEPYRNMIDAGSVDSIMIAHVFNSKLDPKEPASLSHPVVTDLLRKKLGFSGVVISDDLQMGAIAAKDDAPKAAVKALKAGVDLLLFANHEADTELPEKVIAAVKAEVPVERIEEAFARVMKFKLRTNHSVVN